MKEVLKILVLDDDEVDRIAIQRLLAKTSLQTEILQAGSAAEAQEYLGTHQFDFIFLDYLLPDSDGITLVKQLRAKGFLPPIVALTGQGDEQTAVELMKAGASDYLSKSRLSPHILERLIYNAMRVYRAEQRTRAAQEELKRTNALLKQQNQELENQRRQIEQQNLQLLEASRHKSEFLATVTHELRTPLNSIMGFSQILRSQSKGTLNSYQIEMVNRIFSNGENLLNLVNDILDMSTIEANHLELKPSFFDVRSLVNETMDELLLLIEKKGLETRIIFNLEEPIIFNDRQRLKQILINLISNAIKFTDRGFIHVQVNSSADDSLEIVVRDTGIGISKDVLSHIFHPFRQGDQTTKRQYPGTGLGLAITHALVTMMGGTIQVETELAKGTTFKVSIPQQIPGSPAKTPGEMVPQLTPALQEETEYNHL